MGWLNKSAWCGVMVLFSTPSWAQPVTPATPPASPPTSQSQPSASSTTTTPLSAPLSGVNLGEFDTTTPGQLKWENNPFVKTTESVGVQDMRLMAIVYRPGNAAALINGRIVKEGDRIGENQVVHVEAKRVVMRNSDGIFSLTMSGANQ